MDDEFTGIEEAAEAEDAMDLAVLDGVDEGETDEGETDEGELETEVTCTEHTPENLRGYAILLALVVIALAGYMLFV